MEIRECIFLIIKNKKNEIYQIGTILEVHTLNKLTWILLLIIIK